MLPGAIQTATVDSASSDPSLTPPIVRSDIIHNIPDKTSEDKICASNKSPQGEIDIDENSVQQVADAATMSETVASLKDSSDKILSDEICERTLTGTIPSSNETANSSNDTNLSVIVRNKNLDDTLDDKLTPSPSGDKLTPSLSGDKSPDKTASEREERKRPRHNEAYYVGTSYGHVLQRYSFQRKKKRIEFPESKYPKVEESETESESPAPRSVSEVVWTPRTHQQVLRLKAEPTSKELKIAKLMYSFKLKDLTTNSVIIGSVVPVTTDQTSLVVARIPVSCNTGGGMENIFGRYGAVRRMIPRYLSITHAFIEFHTQLAAWDCFVDHKSLFNCRSAEVFWWDSLPVDEAASLSQLIDKKKNEAPIVNNTEKGRFRANPARKLRRRAREILEELNPALKRDVPVSEPCKEENDKEENKSMRDVQQQAGGQLVEQVPNNDSNIPMHETNDGPTDGLIAEAIVCDVENQQVDTKDENMLVSRGNDDNNKSNSESSRLIANPARSVDEHVKHAKEIDPYIDDSEPIPSTESEAEVIEVDAPTKNTTGIQSTAIAEQTKNTNSHIGDPTARKRSKARNPWITDELIVEIEAKDKLYKLWNKTRSKEKPMGDSETYEPYKELRRELKHRIYEAKLKYQESIGESKPKPQTTDESKSVDGPTDAEVESSKENEIVSSPSDLVITEASESSALSDQKLELSAVQNNKLAVEPNVSENEGPSKSDDLYDNGTSKSNATILLDIAVANLEEP